MNKNDKIYVAGHRGLVGGAITRNLQARGYHNLLVRTHAELDLCDQQATETFFAQHKPDHVFLAAARVGGILANSDFPAEFIRDNLAVQTNVIHAAYRTDVQRLLFLGSSCIYPKRCPQPMQEEHLLSGPLEPTNRPYALAKIAGIEMCWSYNRQYGTRYLAAMPTNLYGPGDNYHPQNSHVIPALIRKVHEAKLQGQGEITIWGTGSPRREFLHVDDCADAVVHLMKAYSGDQHVNVGSGSDLTILELVHMICEVVGFQGAIAHDTSKPDGTPRKLMSAEKLRAQGWSPRISLRDGLRTTYQWYLENAPAAQPA